MILEQFSAPKTKTCRMVFLQVGMECETTALLKVKDIALAAVVSCFQ